MKTTNQVVWGLTLVLIGGTTTESATPDRTPVAPKLVRSRSFGRPILSTAPAWGRWAGIYDVEWSPDGRHLAAAGSPGYDLRLWNAARGKEERVLHGHEGAISSVAWSPDGKRLASAGDDNAVRLWEAATGRLLRVLGHPTPVRNENGLSCVRWSPDGSRVATGGLGELHIWNADTGKLAMRLSRTAWMLGWSPDGKRFATAGWSSSGLGTLSVLDASTWEEQRVMHHEGVVGLAWSPDGTRLASSSNKLTAILVWDVASGKLERKLGGGPFGNPGHSAFIDDPLKHVMVSDVAWSPDGQLLASGGADQTVRIWDPAAGQELKVLRKEMGQVRSLAWSPDGKRLASSADDRVVRVWELTFPKH